LRHPLRHSRLPALLQNRRDSDPHAEAPEGTNPATERVAQLDGTVRACWRSCKNARTQARASSRRCDTCKDR